MLLTHFICHGCLITGHLEPILHAPNLFCLEPVSSNIDFHLDMASILWLLCLYIVNEIEAVHFSKVSVIGSGHVQKQIMLGESKRKPYHRHRSPWKRAVERRNIDFYLGLASIIRLLSL